jgi:hypothetical protein
MPPINSPNKVARNNVDIIDIDTINNEINIIRTQLYELLKSTHENIDMEIQIADAIIHKLNYNRFQNYQYIYIVCFSIADKWLSEETYDHSFTRVYSKLIKDEKYKKLSVYKKTEIFILQFINYEIPYHEFMIDPNNH